MKSRLTISGIRVIGAAALLGASTFHAMADTSACTCLVSEAATAGAVTGNVLVSGEGGFAPLVEGTALTTNARVLTGPDAGATISYGATCKVDLPANSRLTMVKMDDLTCVKTEAIFAEPTVVYSTQNEGDDRGVIAGGALLAAAALALALGGSSSSP